MLWNQPEIGAHTGVEEETPPPPPPKKGKPDACYSTIN